MKAQDFAALEQALSGNARGIVGRILSQSRAEGPLAPWEEQFLEARIFQLDFPALASWLAHRPRDPKLVIEAIAALDPQQDSLAAWHLSQHAEAIGPGSWMLLVERLKSSLRLPAWEDVTAANAPLESAQHRSDCADSKDANPLSWLDRHGVPRGELVMLALDGIIAPDVNEATLAEVIRWLGERMVSRSAWESHGEAVLYRFYTRWGWDLIGPLFQLLHHAIERSRVLANGDGKPIELARGLLAVGASPSWTAALHESLARVIVRVARESLQRGESARAKASLAALLHLNPPARVVPLVHCLHDLPDLAADIAELVELNVHLFRRENGRAATLEGVLNTLRELPLG